MTPHQQHVINYFNDTYDDYRWLWGLDRHLGLHCGFVDKERRRHDEAVTNMNRVLAAMAGIGCGDRVLDAGCGIGGSALWLATNLGCRVMGVNISASQVDIAKELTHRRQLEACVQFRVADFTATGLPQSSFDVVWALESMCYAEDKVRFLMEAQRLLRPGGRLIVADGFLKREKLAPDEHRIIERWRQGWAIPNVVSVRRFYRWLSDAGFRQIRFRDITEHVASSSQRIYLASLLLYPLCFMLHWLGMRTEIQTRGIASGYYQHQMRRRGLGVYGVFAAEK